MIVMERYKYISTNMQICVLIFAAKCKLNNPDGNFFFLVWELHVSFQSNVGRGMIPCCTQRPAASPVASDRSELPPSTSSPAPRSRDGLRSASRSAVAATCGVCSPKLGYQASRHSQEEPDVASKSCFLPCEKRAYFC